jgi:prefoldin subunit 5
MNTLEELQQKLQELETAIAETKKRIPPHSVKPPVMIELFDLEDQYDDILKKIKQLKQNASP